MAHRITDWRPPSTLGSIPTELVATLVLATALRVYRLDSESLWIDEHFMVQMATAYSPAELLFEIPMFEPHPPLYNLFMWAWVALGDATALWMRSTSVVFAIATIPVLYALACRLFDRQTATIAIVLFAVSPLQIWYAQEARMYALLVLATVCSWYVLIRLRESITPALVLAYLLTAAVLGYTHVYGLFVILAQATVVAWWCYRQEPRWSLSPTHTAGLYGAIGAIVSPWLAILATRVFVPDPEFDDPAGWLITPALDELVETGRIHLLGSTRARAPYDLLPELPALAALVVILPLILLVFAWFLEDLDAPSGSLGLVLAWVAIPVAVPFILSFLVQPMFELRYTIVAAPAVLLLLANGVRAIRRPHLRVILAVLLVLTMAYPLPAYYDEPQKDQWAEAAALVEGDVTEDSVIIIAPGWTESAFTYYYDDGGTLVPVYAGSPPATYQEAVAGADRVVLVASYLDDPEAILERTTTAMDRPPDRTDRFVRITIYTWS